MNPTKPNIGTIISIAAFVLTLGGALITVGQLISKIENSNIMHKEAEDRLIKQIDELKTEIISLRKASTDIEERTDDLEESRAYEEGKLGVDRTK
jgi:archaellum component FlaF (FlaF/FlaG flagellin family)